MTTIEFSPSRYVASHGRLPKGRGSWAFVVKHCNTLEEHTFFVPGSMTYSDAKVWARAYVREHFDFCLADIDVLVAP